MTGRRCNRSSGESGRVSAILAVNGAHDTKRPSAEAGETVALGKLDAIKTGDTASSGKIAPKALVEIEPCRRCWQWRLLQRTERTTSSSARRLLRLNEEDPSLTMVQNTAHP